MRDRQQEASALMPGFPPSCCALPLCLLAFQTAERRSNLLVESEEGRRSVCLGARRSLCRQCAQQGGRARG